ncbi:hypothetical protein E4K72_13795 [Oxalobacteraceae bacterium OM1]|nr:hypothetical protein E4K72_13795 [Oxalobacteraceae bacterium OM1]
MTVAAAGWLSKLVRIPNFSGAMQHLSMKTLVRTLLLAAACSAALDGHATGNTSAQTPLPDAVSSAPATSMQPAALADALRKGGYVVYFRHAATDFTATDDNMQGYDDCAHQRPLSPQGRDTARKIGLQLRTLSLPQGEVLASPFCRTMETARLAFGKAEPRPEIRESKEGDYPGLKRLLATPVPAGQIRWIVGHGNPFRAVAGPPHLAEGEAAVIQPQGDRWTVIARLRPEDWATLRPRS